MSDEPPIRFGIRVDDVASAAALYESLGFVPFATVPDEQGNPAIAILRRGPLQLVVDALRGLPFPDTVREQQIKTGPRGLGMVVGIEVDDVDQTTRRSERAGCTITAPPADAPWGERYAEVLDPYGYAWKFFRTR